jgi:hypothetical protein
MGAKNRRAIGYAGGRKELDFGLKVKIDFCTGERNQFPTVIPSQISVRNLMAFFGRLTV